MPATSTPAAQPAAAQTPAGYVDKEHPGSKIRRVRNVTIDAVDRVRQAEARPAGAAPRAWTEQLDIVVNAGLVALGHDPIFPPTPEPETTTQSEEAATGTATT